MATDDLPQRYKFVVGKGDAAQENLLNQAAGEDGFRAIAMVFDASGVGGNAQIVVLMERET
jgi:hypothetical protein